MYLLTVEISVLRPDVNYLFHAALKPSSRVFVKYLDAVKRNSVKHSLDEYIARLRLFAQSLATQIYSGLIGSLVWRRKAKHTCT